MHYSLILPLITTLAAMKAATATSYDYIIVGGGTAGLTVTNRLSEDPAVSVLVIEPGQNRAQQSQYWAYQTTEQNFSNRRQVMRDGRALGGTSVMNVRSTSSYSGAAYARAERAQIDALQALGNNNWAWDNLFPYYLKSEKVQPPNSTQSAAGASIIPEYHGQNGPVQVGFMDLMLQDDQGVDLTAALNRTLASLGVYWNRDLNTGSMGGFAMHPYTVDAQGVRSDATRAYYTDLRAGRSNLHVMLNASISKIRWQEAENEQGSLAAETVEVKDGFGSRVVQARREVILAAGAMRSAGILELSGVGNPQILQKHGIPVQIDLPSVGENLQDQLNTSFVVSTRSPVTGTRTVAFVSASDLFGSSTDGAMTKEALQLLYTSQHDLIFNKGIPIGEFVFILDNPNQIHVGYWGLLPFSRGNVHISSLDVAVLPRLSLNYGMIDWDIQVQIAMSKFLRMVFQTGELNELIEEELEPGFANIPADADDEIWKDWIAEQYTPSYHAVGSTSMQPREMGGVLNSRFKVYGTRNVRVVDSSILPVQLCGHPTANIYAIAEWAADMIKEDRLFSDMRRTGL
ncbi:GMC family oxidoreductase [Aspergillus aculeatinus CBS 121060]|uniref:Glucose oxidase n=1 Tax=Aspergillus aculeatinus CBS 121060 TaxID=1448322 RepID=A0ACD1HAA1_9EURO|nr:putative glucose oxidase [Aspergillus aculeatinus CBS 121060]RAH70482.1 putative glucose oxidase [Aspergillus aculeatinus CBS 121060]